MTVLQTSTATDPDERRSKDTIYQKILDEQFKRRIERTSLYQTGMHKAYGLIMMSYIGTALKAKIEAQQDFETKIKDSVIELLIWI